MYTVANACKKRAKRCTVIIACRTKREQKDVEFRKFNFGNSFYIFAHTTTRRNSKTFIHIYFVLVVQLICICNVYIFQLI